MSAETDAAEQDEKTGLVGLLSMTTLGQLGVGRTLCQTAGSSGVVHIDCGEGSSIGLIEACVHGCLRAYMTSMGVLTVPC